MDTPRARIREGLYPLIAWAAGAGERPRLIGSPCKVKSPVLFPEAKAASVGTPTGCASRGGRTAMRLA